MAIKIILESKNYSLAEEIIAILENTLKNLLQEKELLEIKEFKEKMEREDRRK